jgi:addiction module RelE/StbE family toxin
MLPLIWAPEARDDLFAILDYIADRNPTAAARLHAAIEYTVDQLPAHPFVYRSGRVAGTREAVVHPNYIIVYQVGAASIDILAVLHARQRYP